MTLQKRRLTALLFFILFFIGVPPLIMVTSGVFFNTTKRNFQKTGLLVVSSIPREAKISLNNDAPRRGIDIFAPWRKFHNPKTPKRITYLFPGVYTLRLDKEGYMPFEKTVEIVGGGSTFVENIVLFPDYAPAVLLNADVMSVSPDGSLALSWAEGDILTISDTLSHNTLYTAAKIKKPLSIEWLNNPFVVIQYHEDSFLLNYSSGEIHAVPLLNANHVLRKDPADTARIYWVDGTRIHTYDTLSKEIVSEIISKTTGLNDTFDWYVRDADLYLIENNTIRQKNRVYTPPEGITLTSILFKRGQYLYVRTTKKTVIALRTNTGEWLTLVGENQKSVQYIFENKGPRVWWYDVFDVGYIDTDTLTNTLVTRMGSPIVSFTKIPIRSDTEIYVISTEKSVKALDTNVRTSTLYDAPDEEMIDTIVLHKDSLTLNIVTKRKNSFSLLQYQLERK